MGTRGNLISMTRRRLVVLGTVTASVVVGVLAATGAHGRTEQSKLVGKVGFGVHLTRGDEQSAERALKTLRAAGVTWIRDDFDWATVQPTPTSYDWTRPDLLMRAAARARVHVLAIIGYSARWAASISRDEISAPRQDAEYAAYARRVVLRYGPNGEFWRMHRKLRPMPLTAVELWNEPWAWWYWHPQPDPDRYARLSHAAAVAIRRAKPHTTILIAGDAFTYERDESFRPFIERVLAADPALSTLVSAYSIHLYSGRRGPADKTGEQRFRFDRITLTSQAIRLQQAVKPIWVTEFGWSTASAVEEGVPEATQARNTIEAIRRAVNDFHAAKVFVYDYDRSTGDSSDLSGNYGVLRADGLPKPVWRAVVQLLRGR